MLEVEVKYQTSDWGRVRAALAAWGAVADPPREDTDHYFNAPDRDFAKTDEAVRLRRIGATNFITYKGPKRESATKTRTEVELRLADGAEAAATAVRLLTGLGYKPVAVVAKARQVYRVNRGGFELEVCLDDVGAVGLFVELEIQAEDDRFEAAKAVVLEAAAEMGLTNQERRSYLQLLLGKK
ncbi:MAG TPA: class IV adenylate cyclase [Fimbriiglobus sp.]|nr:class IV adenylate cyclase [Fimbriiglobus sp.]